MKPKKNKNMNKVKKKFKYTKEIEKWMNLLNTTGVSKKIKEKDLTISEK